MAVAVLAAFGIAPSRASLGDDVVTVAADARRSLGQNDTKTAVSLYDRVRRLDPEEKAIRWSRDEQIEWTFAYLTEGRYDEALLQALAVKYAAPKLASVNYVVGRIHHAREDWFRALEAFNECAFPPSEAAVDVKEQRKCRLALAGLHARTGNNSRALELVAQVLPETIAENERAALRWLRVLSLHGAGDVRAAVEAADPTIDGPLPWLVVYHTLFSPAPAKDRKRLEVWLTEAAAAIESPFLVPLARVGLHATRSGPEVLRLLAEALDSVFVRRPSKAPAVEPVLDEALTALQRAFDDEFAQFLVDRLDRAPGSIVDSRFEPSLEASVVRPPVGDSRFRHIEVRVTPPRGVKAIVVAVDGGKPRRLDVSALRGRVREGRLETFVSVSASPKMRAAEVSVEIIGKAGAAATTIVALEPIQARSRLHLLAIAVDEYRGTSFRTATRDAVRVAGAVGDRLLGGATIDVLLNEDATASRIREWFRRPRLRNDVLLVFLRTPLRTAAEGEWGILLPSRRLGDAVISATSLVELAREAAAGTTLFVVEGDPADGREGGGSQVAAQFLGARPKPMARFPSLPVDKRIAILTAQHPLQAGVVNSAAHGASLHTVGLLEALNPLISGRRHSGIQTVLFVDVWNHALRQFRRSIVRDVFALAPAQQPFVIPSPEQSAEDVVWRTPVTWSEVGALVDALDQARASTGVEARAARDAARAFRQLPRPEELQMKLDLLETLWKLNGDVRVALARWSLAVGVESPR